jgi:hypothetical protein
MNISSYRLGDLVVLGLSLDEMNLLINDYPESIGADYILFQNGQNGIKKVTNIVLNYINKYKELLPSDIEDSTVIHLRLGDVVSGTTSHELVKRPLNIEYYESLNIKNKIYVLGKCFFASPSSTNYDECITNSNNYLQLVLERLNAIHFDSGNADIDLCCAVLADTFVQGRGFFSKLIVEIRKEIGKNSIETDVTK